MGGTPSERKRVWGARYQVESGEAGLKSAVFEFLEGNDRTEAVTLCGRNAVQILPARKYRLDLQSLQRRFSILGSVTLSTHLLKLCTEDYELAVFPDGRAIVKGTSDPAEARSVYIRYVGD